jgi:hypothetical protein
MQLPSLQQKVGSGARVSTCQDLTFKAPAVGAELRSQVQAHRRSRAAKRPSPALASVQKPE